MSTDPTTFSTAHLQFFFQSKRAGFDAHLVARLVDFVDQTRNTLDCAIYDLRQPDVLAALRRVARGGKQLRIAYHGAQASTAQALKNYGLLSHSFAVHPVGSHLMHHKFVVRDGDALWNGSANFTGGGLELQDNNCLIARSASLARQYSAEFAKLTSPQSFFLPPAASKPVVVDGVKLTPQFTTTAAVEGLEDTIVNALGGATRVRVLAFLISDPGILGALTAFKQPGFDVRGVLDPNGMKDALHGKTPDPVLYWFLKDKRFRKAPSHAFDPAPGAEQDFMHNKVMIVGDRLVITGSYNFSENAEANDENLLLVESAQVAAAYNRYFDAVYAVPGNK